VVYLAGTSYSGSTILSIVLAADPQLFDAGELCLYHLLDQRQCTCGAPGPDCPFWSRVAGELPPRPRPPGSTGLTRANLRGFLHSLFAPRRGPARDSAHAALARVVFRCAAAFAPGTTAIVDASKSLQYLIALIDAPGIDVRVVHLIRAPRRNIASFRKYGESRRHGAAAWLLVNIGVRLLVWRHRLRACTVHYEELCDAPARVLARLNAALGLDIPPERYVAAVNARDYHVCFGNPSRQSVASGRQFPGLVRR
jgi:hypothetical protein